MTWMDFVVRGTLVMAAAFVGTWAFSRASAALRHFVWTAAFAALVLLPGALRAPKIAIPVWSAAEKAVASPAEVLAAVPEVGRQGKPARSPVPTPVQSVPRVALYLGGVLAVAVRFMAGARRTSRMVRGARAAEWAQPAADALCGRLNLGREVRVLESQSAGVPMMWGLLRPVVLLPKAAREWSVERLEAVLLHELIHVRRRDLVSQAIAQAACCVYWFHPLVWWAAGRLRREREAACDDAVLAIGVAAPDYAGHLLELARALGRRNRLSEAPAMAGTSDLEERVRGVLDVGRNRAPVNRRLAATVAVLACALVLPVGLVTVRAQAPSGALNGIVEDASKARVPGSAVSIRNLDGKNEEVARANPAGEFGFAAIPPGRYAVEVRARGFAVGKTEVKVERGRTVTALVTLPIGNVTEVVTVKGTAAATGSLAPAVRPERAAVPAERIRVGGNVQATRIVRQVRPVYPEALKSQGITGTVMLRAVISVTGEPLNVEVVNTAVNYGLAQAALEAVRQWRYQPSLLNGQPVEVPTTIQVVFELEK